MESMDKAQGFKSADPNLWIGQNIHLPIFITVANATINDYLSNNSLSTLTFITPLPTSTYLSFLFRSRERKWNLRHWSFKKKRGTVKGTLTKWSNTMQRLKKSKTVTIKQSEVKKCEVQLTKSEFTLETTNQHMMENYTENEDVARSWKMKPMKLRRFYLHLYTVV